jgi:hypothetical protein
MTLPASGQISLNDINVETGRTGTTANTSLTNMSNGTTITINTANAASDRPDGSAPHAMSEFYSYNHNAAVSFGTWSSNSSWTLDGNAGGADQFTTAQIGVTGGDGTNIDIYYTTTSGTVRGGLYVAMSLSATPPNSAATASVSNTTGGFAPSFPITGNQTLYLKFKYDVNNSLDEDTTRNVKVRQGTTDSPNWPMTVSTLAP